MPNPPPFFDEWNSGNQTFSVRTVCDCAEGDTECVRICKGEHDAAVTALQGLYPKNP